MANTRIVLNRQSDLILTEAQIVAPVGIVEADIAGLVQHFEAVEKAAKAEEDARIKGDQLLTDNLNAEIERATVKDTEHDVKIESNTAKINEESARAKAKDAEHDASITQEIADRSAADAAHDVEIAAIKETEATNVATLQGNIDSEQARAEAAEKVNADAIAKEVSDRISAVSTEEAARIAGDAALQASLDAMDAAYKSADAGLQSAIDSAQAEINGILSGSTLDANSFAEIVAIMNSIDAENDTAFAAYVSSNNAALATEVADRVAGDDKLTSDLAAEVVRATAAEAANAAAIAKEEADRVAADAALQASLDAEISGRTAADVAFQSSLDAEIANRVAGDNTLTTNLNAEVARAEAAEQVNAQAIADEVLARTTKDTLQDNALSAETASRIAGDKEIEESLGKAVSNLEAADSVEAAARAEGDAKLTSDLAAEIERSTVKDTEHDVKIESNTAKINEEKARSTAKDAEHDAAIAAEEARAIAAEGVLDTAIKAEEARAKSKDAEHDAAIAAEEARAIAAEGVLDAAIAAEEARSIAAEKANAEAIAKEEAERKDSDKAHDEAIATEKARIDAILESAALTADTFVEVVNLINSVDTDNDEVFGAYVIKNDAAVEENKKSIEEETSRSKAKDAEHDAAIAAEEARAIAAEKANAEAIAKEESERIAAVAELHDVNKKQDEKSATFESETGENFAKLNQDLQDEIKRATDAEGELTVKVADIIENTDVSKIDSFVEVINEFNKVSEANFDSIYAKKVSVSFNGVSEVILANPVKPESMMLYINGLMVENGVDYTEIVEGGMVAGATLLGDALDLAVAGAKLASYGVHGSFSSVEFNGIDYAALINDKQVELAKLEAQKDEATAKEKQSAAEFEDLTAKLKSEIEAANAAGDADYAAKVESELANLEAARTEELTAFKDLENSINSQIQSLNAEIATLQAEANEG